MDIIVQDSKPNGFQAQVEVAACFIEIDGKLLIVQRAAGKESGKWGVPAGKLEANETVEMAAKRELFEETGIKIKNVSQIQQLKVLYIRKPEIDYVYHLCKIDLQHMPQIILSDEHQDYRWVSLSEIEQLALMDGATATLHYYRSALKYAFKPYSPIFPELFDKEKARIGLKDASVEHVGSTAVPNLGGKGIIDIAVAVKKENMNSVSEQLQRLGYEYHPNFSTAERLYFVTFQENRRYHLHLTFPESIEWKNLIGFRDYLRNHQEAVSEYEELKKKAALEANNNGEHYRQLKEPFFKKST